MLNPYPSWLRPGANAWQLVAATLVGLMSIPGIAVLYGGIVHKKWVVNTMTMAFTAFASVLIVWVLWAFKMGFGSPIHLGPGFLSHFLESLLKENQTTAEPIIPMASAPQPFT